MLKVSIHKNDGHEETQAGRLDEIDKQPDDPT